MGLEISQGAVVYILLMLAIIFIGVYYVTGGNFIQFIKGEKLFSAPKISIVGFADPFASCTGNSYVVRFGDPTQRESVLRITYSDTREQDVEIYPVLDVGNNPLLDDSENTIKCTFDETSGYSCDKKALVFTLTPQKIQTSKTLNNKNTFVQLYFFKKTFGIRQYLSGRSTNDRTTSNLLMTYNDYYVFNQEVRFSDKSYYDTTCLQATFSEFCKTLDKYDCTSNRYNEYCYLFVVDGGEPVCKSCPSESDFSSCENYDKYACTSCKILRERCTLQSGTGGSFCRTP
ncbi:MAG: hypothetical protein HY514_00390 [Candidatus Aenigmarchaeota archaeon]|nr:hypothetical protein [Candidatus Aenigmarchaeota archaeon]